VKQTILVADDSLTIQRLVAQTFADADVRIVSVSNGDAAIRKFEEVHPDLVLADIYMPGKNGYEVCSHVKHHASLSSTPVILLVGAFDAFEADTAAKAGAAAHIKKPFEPRALVELVQSLLQGGSREAESSQQTVQAVDAEPAHSPEESTASASGLKEEPVPAFDEGADLLGLEDLFKPPNSAPSHLSVTDEEIDRIADRVIKKLSTQVIESVAWDVVPDITEKVLREELKRNS
jgi:CheY-like chemotaxis protein